MQSPTDQPGRDRRASLSPHRRTARVVVGRARRVEAERPRTHRVGDSVSARPNDSRARSVLRAWRCGPGDSEDVSECSRRRHRSGSVFHVDLQSGESAGTDSGEAGGERSARTMAGSTSWRMNTTWSRRSTRCTGSMRSARVNSSRTCTGDCGSGGVFLVAEPASAETPFAAGFEAWKAKQPPRYSQENWQRFWSRADSILGYDHVALWGPRDDDRIGDELSVAGWTGLLERAGFESIDVLLRDADQVVIGAVKAGRLTRSRRRMISMATTYVRHTTRHTINAVRYAAGPGRNTPNAQSRSRTAAAESERQRRAVHSRAFVRCNPHSTCGD